MAGDIPAHVYLLGIGIPAVATIIVAWISRAGKRTAKDETGYKPNDENGEHAHTRQVILRELTLLTANVNRLHDRIDKLFGYGAERQAAQRRVSMEHLLHEDKEEDSFVGPPSPPAQA
jgi:hypothetical protein